MKNSAGKWGKKKSTFSAGFRIALSFLRSHRFSGQKRSIWLRTAKRGCFAYFTYFITWKLCGSGAQTRLKGSQLGGEVCGAITASSQAQVLQKPGIPAEMAWDETTPSERLIDTLLGLLAKIKCGSGQFTQFKTTFSGRDGELSQDPKLRLDLNSAFA